MSARAARPGLVLLGLHQAVGVHLEQRRRALGLEALDEVAPDLVVEPVEGDEDAQLRSAMTASPLDSRRPMSQNSPG